LRNLILNAQRAEFLVALLPFLKGFSVFFWATATWWIPMLVTLAIWRHVYKRFRLAYDPLYWGAVFPLGMYTVSTHQLAQALDPSIPAPDSPLPRLHRTRRLDCDILRIPRYG